MNKKAPTLETKEIDLLNRKHQIMKMLNGMKGIDLSQEDMGLGDTHGGEQDSQGGFKKSQVIIPPLDFSKLKSYSS